MVYSLAKDWTNGGTSFRWDAASFVVALLLHSPLFWMTFSPHEKSTVLPPPRLIRIEMLLPAEPKPTPSVIHVKPHIIETPSIQRPELAPRRDLPLPPPRNRNPEQKLSMDHPKSISLETKLDMPQKPDPIESRIVMLGVKDPDGLMIRTGQIGFKMPPSISIDQKIDKGQFYGPAIEPNPMKSAVPEISPVVPAPKTEKLMFAISGSLKDRKREREVIPQYPAREASEGIRGTVILDFTVASDGTVNDTIFIRRSSGYTRLDESAIKALLQWKFVPLPAGENREEIGTITFNYSLS